MLSSTLTMASKWKWQKWWWRLWKLGSDGHCNDHPCLLLGQVATVATDTTVSGAVATNSAATAITTFADVSLLLLVVDCCCRCHRAIAVALALAVAVIITITVASAIAVAACS
jgi:hypothetical protein